MEFTHYISEILDKSSQTQVNTIHTDFQKDFDKVDHHLTLEKNAQIRILIPAGDPIWELSTAVQAYVVYNGVRSCDSGVPHGGNLAPLIFLIYVNNIPQILKHSQRLLFEDDLKIYFKKSR